MVTTFKEFQHDNRRVYCSHDSKQQWLKRHQAVCAKAPLFGKRGLSEVGKFLIQRVRLDRNLILAVEHVAQESGACPGPDGEIIRGLDVRQQADYGRAVRDEIDRGDYEHMPARVHRIRKSSGKGTRPIHLLNLEDRIVHRAVNQVIGPVFDAVLSPYSLGGRPRCSCMLALAVAADLAAAGRRIWVVADLENAFEHVNQERLLDVLGLYLPVAPHEEIKQHRPGVPVLESIHGLLRKVLVTRQAPGIRQGAPSSPLMLNVYLHHLLDRPWQKLGGPPQIRWIDDILLACESVEEAKEAIGLLANILKPIGMLIKPPKGKSNIYDLAAGESVRWLGYNVRWSGSELRIGTSAQTWDRLIDNFDAWAIKDPNGLYVRGSLLNWAHDMGPAYPYENRPRAHSWICEVAGLFGFKGKSIPSAEDFENAWAGGYDAWTTAALRSDILSTNEPLFL